jgi:nitrite reductase/ring-hydroxylating ferredoxin subunit
MLAGLPSEDLPVSEGVRTEIRRVRVGESHVLVARLASGEVVAFGPSCPHQFTELDEATIWDGNLRCPRHSYLFDTRTGENVHPRREARVENLWKLRPGYLPCYEVREHDGWIWVSDEAKPPPDSYDPALEVRPENGGPGGAAAAAAGAGAAAAGAGAAGAGAGASASAGASVAAGPVAVAPAGPVEASLRFLNAEAGDAFDVRLPFLPRPGHAWSHQILGEILTVVGEHFEPGFSPCQVVRVAATGGGAATLTCTYGAEGGSPVDIRTFIVRVKPA